MHLRVRNRRRIQIAPNGKTLSEGQFYAKSYEYGNMYLHTELKFSSLYSMKYAYPFTLTK